MDKINKDFDGVSWEWTGRRAIRNLKPICPECQYELDITMSGLDMKYGEETEDGGGHITLSLPEVIYSCPKCPFSANTNIDDVKAPRDLRKAVRKEFEHRQRLMLRDEEKQ
jgi:hypothetical protein